MKRFLLLGTLVALSGWRTQATTITNAGWFNAGSLDALVAAGETEEDGAGGDAGPMDAQSAQSIAEAITPDIQALADGLQHDPVQIFNYVHDHIRYVLYFGSKKGAELTLLEKSGNDFDQCALLVAMLRAAGYTNAAYQFGWMLLPYDNPDGSHRDLHHWLGLGLANNNWTTTAGYLDYLFRNQRWYPTDAHNWGDNTFAFQRVWVTLPISGTTNYLDPSFKVSEPIAGISLTNAMGASTASISNALLSAAQGTEVNSYASNLDEAAIRGVLTGYTTNFLGYLQSNYPNASVEEVLGGAYIVPSTNTTLGQGLLFPTTNLNGTMPIVNWTNQPTNFMSTLTVDLAGVTNNWLMPQLQGQRLSLTFSNNGVAQLWLEDSNVLQVATDGVGSTYVTLNIYHPSVQSSWNAASNSFVPGAYYWKAWKTYQKANASYALLYAFEPDWGWLRQRQQKLEAYRQQFSDTSRQVVTETLNVMGLNWQLQTEYLSRMLAAQIGVLPQFYHRMGRMSQEAGWGYYVDAYMLLNGAASSASSSDNHYTNWLDHWTLFASAMEHGLIEQLQSTNWVGASTVKMLQLANTNHQVIYLANTTNWSTIRPQLANWNTNYVASWINKGYTLLLPQNGAIQLAGAGSWTGYGLIARIAGASIGMNIGDTNNTHNGGFVSDFTAVVNPPFVDLSAYAQPRFFNLASAFGASPTGADPVNLADGSFQVEAADLSLGQVEPRGLNLSRHYSSSRRNSNLTGMAPGWVHNYYANAATVSAPEAGLGGTTPAQMAPMLVATCAAINFFDGVNLAPRNWTITALIAKWGVDQLINHGVSINLGKDTIQFVKQPDGTFTPPAKCTMTLTKPGGIYALQERHGRTFNFDATNRLASIVDAYASVGLSLTYTTSNWVNTVRDWTNRTLTFSYTGTPQRLTSVSDGARTVYYGYSTTYNTNGDLTSFTDAEGKTGTFIYDASHQVIGTKDALSRLIVSNAYNSFGRVTNQYSQGLPSQTWQIFWSDWQTVEQDPAGGKRQFFYDDKHRLTALQDALGNTTQTFYDGQDHVVMAVSPLNETNRFLFDGRHNLLRTTDPLGYTNGFLYDSQDNLIQSTDARGNQSHFGYNAQFSLTGSTNGAGDWVTFVYNGDGTPQTRADSAGTTTYTYDSYGQLSSVAYPNSLGSESFINTPLGDVTNHTNPRGFVTSFQYNNRRQLTKTVAPTNVTISIVYDDVGNVQSATDARTNTTLSYWSPTRLPTGAVFPTTPQGTPAVTNFYDSRDWLFRTINPQQSTINYTNDPAHRLLSLTDPLQRTTRSGYDNDGRQTAATNAAMEVTRQEWSKRGQLTKATDPATRTVRPGYDQAGNQTVLTNRNTNVWQFQFDAVNRLTNTITPLNRQTKLAFNDRGLLQSATDPMGRATAIVYDARGRAATNTDQVGVRAYAYDANNNLTNLSETLNSQLSTLNYTYDAYDRLSTYRDVDGNLIQYGYDSNGNLTRLVYPGGKAVIYAYDGLNRLTTVTDWANRQTSIEYDLAGRPTKITRPNGTVRTIAYDAAGQTTNIVEKTTNNFPIAFFAFNWTNAGRIQWEFAAPLPHAYSPPTRTMYFDADNRMTNFNNQIVGYDLNGNMTNGPLFSSSLVAYQYDARRRLTHVEAAGAADPVTDYFYDAAGNRVAVVAQYSGPGDQPVTNRYIINPQPGLSQVLMRIQGSVTNYYVYGLGLLYEAKDDGSARYYHYDYRGSTIALSDDAARIVGRAEYSAYGILTGQYGASALDPSSPAPQLGTPFMFNGRYGVMTDPNGLLYMRARYYNPYVCRFISADPVGFSGGLNWYAYADGNPIGETDPFGLGPWTSLGGLGRMVGGGLEASVGYTFAVASGTAAVGTSPTVVGAVGFGALAVGGAAVGAHGIDTFQAGARQFWTGEHVDSLTSQNLQAAGMSRTAANLTDAGIGVVGSLGAGLATAPIRVSTIAATDPLAQGLNSGEILSMWETGSRAVNAADWAALGGQVAPEAALYRAMLMENGINMSGEAYQLTTTALQQIGVGTRLFLQGSGLTPAAAQGAGYIGAGLNAVSGATDWLGRPISNGGK